MSFRSRIIPWPFKALAAGLLLCSCALDEGEAADCPECDNVTELLVGDKCVAIEEVAKCGPDGHSHGDACHCFSGQDPTEINGTMYCLQQGCAGADAGQDSEEDVDMQACEHLGDSAEAATAVETFEEFDQAHVDLDLLAEIALPADHEGFVHFPGMETTEYAVFVSTTGAVDAFLDADGESLDAQNMGSNTDCPDDFKEVWHVSVTNNTGSPLPQVIRFKAGSVASVKVVILKAS